MFDLGWKHIDFGDISIKSVGDFSNKFADE